MSNIAFIGLGNMGSPMAVNLVKAGHQVIVYDLVAAAIEKLVAAGARAADSAVAACEGADFVISMLPAGQHVEQLYLGDNGLLSQLPTHPLVIDCSTVAASTAVKVAEAAAERGIAMIDAPVSGGTKGAEAGSLTFICGGEANAFEQAKPVLAAMGKNIFLAGGHGSGQIAKICNNMLLSILMAGTAEALNLGVKNGLDPQVLTDIMLQSSGANWALQLYNPYPGVMDNVPAANDYEGGFLSQLMLKDLGLAMATVADSNAYTPMGELAAELYKKHCDSGFANKDFSSIHYLSSDNR